RLLLCRSRRLSRRRGVVPGVRGIREDDRRPGTVGRRAPCGGRLRRLGAGVPRPPEPVPPRSPRGCGGGSARRRGACPGGGLGETRGGGGSAAGRVVPAAGEGPGGV